MHGRLWLLNLLLVAALSACETDGQAVRSIRGDRAVGTHWTLYPVRSRVYPSTRFVREEGAPVLEARIELFDEMGDSVKGVGQWYFELYGGDQRRDGAVTQRLYSWEVPMLLLDEQRLYYDRITRAYLFRLKMDNMAPARRTTTLVATLVMPDGTRLEARELLQPLDETRR